jgi:predicted TIM-barrel fold metal-dependent hydrolase
VLDGLPLVDVHLHAARLPTLRLARHQWVGSVGDPETITRVYDADGTVDPRRFGEYLAGEGVDKALLMAEYSPKVTGIQPIEDLLPLVSHDPDRVRPIGNINPHLHYPVDEEWQRQIGLGAVALKVHPVHGGFAANDRAMYPAYEICQSLGLPIVVHCGTSVFPGAANKYADPLFLDDVLRDFRDLDIVLAHGGRGWWYDAAAFLSLANDHVWIELSGLPPSRLPHYYARHDWKRLSRRMIFGTDWPGVPGIAVNARAVAGLCPDPETAALVLAGNAARVYRLKLDQAAVS